ncbi:MAG: hypothetical protein EXR28_15635 [Betaproteobacteria bacterium]|nr:hypothetical protein [Betaproteobacteria bacterium]
MNNRLLLVGSVPLETSTEVFQTFGKPLGRYLTALPDGEVGPRSHWISRVHYQVFALHHDLEAIRRPTPDDGVERLNPHTAADGWQFRVKPGAGPIRFGDPGWRLGFARDAVNSYFVFQALRDKGVIPAHLRFQVSIPSVNSVLSPRIFESMEDVAKIEPGFKASLKAELEKIVEKIPAKDLAIQWDCANEISEVYGNVKQVPQAGAIGRSTAQFGELLAGIPSDVALGYHLCFGTLGGWPRFVPDDIGEGVNLANALIESAGRRVDWMHIPILDQAGDKFVAPLANLKPRGARVYLGVLHNMAGFKARVDAARKYLSDFGVGAYCGFGRVPPAQMPAVLDEHLQAMKLLD